MASVRFDRVSRHFGKVRAVDEVSFAIADGEFVCLLGPSGCGKTTTLRLVAGLERASAGRIYIGERDVTSLPPKDRDVGMVFQDYALYPHMNLSDNIGYPLKVRGIGRDKRDRRTAEIAEHLQIAHLLGRRPGEISGGQQQRASVARAVVHKPQVFLFDEPLSNLDAKLRLEARSFLKHLQKDLGVTALYVTHDQAEAMALADRIAVMDAGRIVQLGPPLEVYNRPATAFVANFLGNPPMNLLPATVELRDDVARLVGDGFRLPLLPGFRGRLEAGVEVTLGVRPEHLSVHGSAGDWVVSGDLYAVEPLGPETLITLRIGGRLVTARLFSDEPPDLSDRPTLRLDPSRLHLFGADGGRLEA